MGPDHEKQTSTPVADDVAAPGRRVAVSGPFRSGPPAHPEHGPPPLPVGGLDALGCASPAERWEHRWVKPGTDVWRLQTGRGAYWLKVRWPDGTDALSEERDRLDWLEHHLGPSTGLPRFPTLVGYGWESGVSPASPVEWLLTTEVAGVPAHDPRLRMGSIEPLIRGIGEGLRALHDRLSPGDCPFEHRSATLLASARARLAVGGIAPDAGGPSYDRLTAAEKVAYAEEIEPDEPADQLVVAHGDPGLPNLLVDPASGRLVGLVDLGRLGVSDRHRDLAIVVRSFVANFGPEHAWRLVEAYGAPPEPVTEGPNEQPGDERPPTGGRSLPVDPQRLEFHVLLDDLW